MKNILPGKLLLFINNNRLVDYDDYDYYTTTTTTTTYR